MTNIVLYRDGDAPVNDYPERIVSPTRPQACCEASMGPVGQPWSEGRARLQYARCPRCGFTVRRVLDAAPDPAVLRAVQEAFRPLFGDRRLTHERLAAEPPVPAGPAEERVTCSPVTAAHAPAPDALAPPPEAAGPCSTQPALGCQACSG